MQTSIHIIIKKRPTNGLKLIELKERDKAKLLYDCIYSALKAEIDEKVKSIECTASCSDNITSNIQLLKTINGLDENTLTQPEQIRSAASVRLRDTDKKYLTISDYLSYINNLIYDFKKINPGFKDFNELEILAEIQHRGGASCLVDFSKNFLISLWFATNNDTNDPGYLFCYNVNKDAICEDNITYLNKDRWEYPIEDLLKFTRKTTQYVGEDKFRFWLWRPANINGRIARQDSIFVFGLEKFYADKHNVEIITIPPQWKSSIVEALKTYFGITAETIFPDVDGYAGSHSKISKIGTISSYLNLEGLGKTWKSQNYTELIQRGMSCLLNGQYRLALDYFLHVYSDKDSRLNKPKNKNSLKKSEFDNRLTIIRLEVIYSIGLCYKKLGEFNAAEYFLNQAFSICCRLKIRKNVNSKCEIKTNNRDNLESGISVDTRKAISTKFLKIVDDYLDVLYCLHRYAIAKNVISLLLDNQSNNELAKSSLLDNQSNNRILHMLKCMVQRLSILEGIEQAYINNKISIESFDCDIKETDDIFVGINRYHNLIRSIISNPEDVIDYGKIKSQSEILTTYKSFKEFVDNILYGSSNNESLNIIWDFEDVLTAVKEYFKDIKYIYLREFIEDITSQMKSVIDIKVSQKRV